jgi:purine-nucleoside phosphorylase
MQTNNSIIRETAKWLSDRGFGKPVAGIVLGTGLELLVEQMEVSVRVSYADIPHFPVSTVSFHKGILVLGTIHDVPVIVMQGRFHYYEGYSMEQLTFPIRVLHALGIRYLLLSNAAGGMNPDYQKGDLVILEDHINLLPENPLRGLNDPELGNRFADMSCPYDKKLRQLLKEAMISNGLNVREGIYAAVAGPNLETRAEYRWLRSMGADMVGMSTVPEVIVAAQMGLPCAAISIISDICDPDNLQAVDIPEILSVLGKADKKLVIIFKKVIEKGF